MLDASDDVAPWSIRWYKSMGSLLNKDPMDLYRLMLLVDARSPAQPIVEIETSEQRYHFQDCACKAFYRLWRAAWKATMLQFCQRTLISRENYKCANSHRLTFNGEFRSRSKCTIIFRDCVKKRQWLSHSLKSLTLCGPATADRLKQYSWGGKSRVGWPWIQIPPSNKKYINTEPFGVTVIFRLGIFS